MVTFADIRYPTTGIDVLGLPNNSPLVGTTGENRTDNNDSLQNAQQVGNLLTSDRNTISVGGAISDEADVDWYEFEVDYQQILISIGVKSLTVLFWGSFKAQRFLVCKCLLCGLAIIMLWRM